MLEDCHKRAALKEQYRNDQNGKIAANLGITMAGQAMGEQSVLKQDQQAAGDTYSMYLGVRML